ncbi:LamG-like jellyroll fold domain-containing protein [Arcicella rosea]|uniref:Gliding motility-associated-like protein n=1 Tax=Arcicella rosea TaxID=502909 RepID=A0A841ECW2_9BACT|nr:LamG-like jellyroll fold domain-containing protein [Arcicella rosea]MBB6001967.1 gliding motility-associated-like protein [Arcicella rosea]
MKKVNNILLLLILFSTSAIGQINLKNGLVGCYPFNANAKDESGNNNNGIVNGAVLTVDRFGNPNSAYRFDGYSFIDLPDNKFSFDNYSYAMWVFVSDIPTSGNSYRMIAIGGACGDQTLALSYNYFNAVGFDFGVYNKPALANTPLAIGTLPEIGKWYHLTAVRDDLTLNLYINGVLAKSVSSNNTKPYYGCDAVEKARFGIRNGGVQGFKGALDDIHLYNRPLNAAEVKALYDGNTPPTITITSNSASPCGGDKITFTANGGNATSKYLWKIDDVTQTSSSKNLDYTPTKKTGDYQIKVAVEVTDGEPCFPQDPSKKEEIFTVKDCVESDKILIPNAFSPNSDGVNDTWEIHGIKNNPDVIVEIYDRWGELIFYSKGYSTPWDGTYKNSPLNEGYLCLCGKI